MTAPDHPDDTGDVPAEDGRRGEDPTVRTPPPGQGRRWGEYLGVLKSPPDRDSRRSGRRRAEFAAIFFPVFLVVQAGSHHPWPFYVGWNCGGLAVVVLLRLLIAWWFARRRS